VLSGVTQDILEFLSRNKTRLVPDFVKNVPQIVPLLSFVQLELYWKFLSSLDIEELDKTRFFKELDAKHVQNLLTSSSSSKSDLFSEFLGSLATMFEGAGAKEGDEFLKGCSRLFDFDMDRICSCDTLTDLTCKIESLAIYVILRNKIHEGKETKSLIQNLYKSKTLTNGGKTNLSRFLLLFSHLELAKAQSQTLLDTLPGQDKNTSQEWIQSFMGKQWYIELLAK
jgi:hypothetical protein